MYTDTLPMNDSDGDSGNARASLASSSRKRDHRRQNVAIVCDNPLDDDEDNEEVLFFESLLNPNFDELARQFRYFKQVYNTKQHPSPSLLATDKKKKHLPIAPYIATPEFTMALSRALLHVHFGLSLTVEDSSAIKGAKSPSEAGSPSRFLCPPIPNRFFYVQWIVRTLLPMIPGNKSDKCFEQPYPLPLSASQPERESIRGLDIGTGATCIYPLLISHYNRKRLVHRSKENPVIVMHATDIDPLAVQWAKTNVSTNQLQTLVHVHLVPKSSSQAAAQFGTLSNMDVGAVPLVQGHGGPLIRSLDQIRTFVQQQQSLNVTPISKDSDLQLDFVMTNPPFYDFSLNEEGRRGNDDDHQRIGHSVNHIYDPKLQALRGRTTLMTFNEGYYPYGEVGFGLDLVLDSWNLFVAAKGKAKCPPLQNSTANNLSSAPPLPHWISMMCGKKSSFVYLQHAISQLLGPSHVCTTEFGPGEYTRWFLAWTFHRPAARSPLARMNRPWTFHVSITVSPSSASSKATACEQVTNRLMEYCQNLSNHSDPGIVVICEESIHSSSLYRTHSKDNRCPVVRLQMYEKHDPSVYVSSFVGSTCEGDETLPDCLKSCIYQMSYTDRLSFLPSDCGHFLLDISLMIANFTDAQIASDMNEHECIVHVEVDSYLHSTYGRKRVEKIRSQLEHDICRTSRRWRRLLQRHGERTFANVVQPMDES
jgi:23S rRNA A1618 N6-methylase RlmF